MDRSVFAQHFLAAATSARDFARRYLEESLPDEMLFRTLPPTLRSLTLDAPEATDDSIRALLSACPEELNSLGLRGTPASDAVLSALDRFPQLTYLDAVDTRITNDALKRFVDQRPGFKCWPKLNA